MPFHCFVTATITCRCRVLLRLQLLIALILELALTKKQTCRSLWSIALPACLLNYHVLARGLLA
ncbi:MAG: hypothetical protein ACJAVM_001373 [Sulfitobacter sp.]|jgi:hypothetical protein